MVPGLPAVVYFAILVGLVDFVVLLRVVGWFVGLLGFNVLLVVTACFCLLYWWCGFFLLVFLGFSVWGLLLCCFVWWFWGCLVRWWLNSVVGYYFL